MCCFDMFKRHLNKAYPEAWLFTNYTETYFNNPAAKYAIYRAMSKEDSAIGFGYVVYYWFTADLQFKMGYITDTEELHNETLPLTATSLLHLQKNLKAFIDRPQTKRMKEKSVWDEATVRSVFSDLYE